MKYGKITTIESVFNGETASRKTWFEESLEIPDKEHLLTETLEALDLIVGHNTDDLILEVKRNRDGKIRLVKKHLQD